MHFAQEVICTFFLLLQKPEKSSQQQVLFLTKMNFFVSKFLSSLQVPCISTTFKFQVTQIKSFLKPLFWKTRLTHVSAHKGRLGNKTADALAKEAIVTSSADCSHPIPDSHIKSHLCTHVIKKWQDNCSTRTWLDIHMIWFQWFLWLFFCSLTLQQLSLFVIHCCSLAFFSNLKRTPSPFCASGDVALFFL